MLDAIHNLSVATLRSLAASLRGGPLAVGLSRHAIAQVIGPQAADVHENLEELQKQGMALAHMALLLDAIAQTRERAADPQVLFDLVLSGPEVPGVPTADTTEAAQRKNIEVGVLIRYEPFVTRLSACFEALRDSGKLLACPWC